MNLFFITWYNLHAFHYISQKNTPDFMFTVDEYGFSLNPNLTPIHGVKKINFYAIYKLPRLLKLYGL
jgi:hypothetical protein